MLRCATLACGLALAGSYRVVSKGDDRPFSSEVLVNDTQLAQFSENLIGNINPTLKADGKHVSSAALPSDAELAERALSTKGSLLSNIKPTMQALNVNPEAIGVAFIEGIAGFDFNGDLLDQMKDLATSSAVNLAQTIVSSVHPLLGVVFSVFASVFGWGGGDTNATFVKQILEQVDTMIKVSLAEFGAKLIEDELNGVLVTINAAGSNRKDWGTVHMHVAKSFPTVFKSSCWNYEDSSACRIYRTSEGGGAALMMELQFTYLMIASGVTVARFGHALGSFADLINKAALLTKEHFSVFSKYRMDFESSESGLRKGKVDCDSGRGNFNNKHCRTFPSRDLLLKKNICGIGETRCSYGTCKGTEKRLNEDLDTCLRNYQFEIFMDLGRLDRETRAASIAATKILRARRTHRVCAERYELQNGDIPGNGKIDGAGGKQDVNDCDDCADLCDKIAACLSYECSQPALKCNLNTQRDPTEPQHHNFAFCSKF